MRKNRQQLEQNAIVMESMKKAHADKVQFLEKSLEGTETQLRAAISKHESW